MTLISFVSINPSGNLGLEFPYYLVSQVRQPAWYVSHLKYRKLCIAYKFCSVISYADFLMQEYLLLFADPPMYHVSISSTNIMLDDQFTAKVRIYIYYIFIHLFIFKKLQAFGAHK